MPNNVKGFVMKSIARVLVIVACAVMLAVGALSIPVMTASGAKAEPLFGVPTRIPATGTNGQLKDVTCPTATTCIAVGLDGDNQAVSSVGIELGVTWTWSPSREIEPGLRVQTYLFGVACPTATSCVAVGYDGSNQSIYASATLSQGKWYWSLLGVVSPDGSKSDYLESVSCASATTCVAVGNNGRREEIFTIGSEANGTWTWSRIRDMPADSSQAGYLTSVSCGDSTTCVAVGYDGDGQSIDVVGDRSGTNWTWSMSSPVTSDSSGTGELNGIDCASATSCVAVGLDGDYEPITVIGDESGATWIWTTANTVTPDSTGSGAFKSVNCTSASSCVAVGYDSNAQAIFSSGVDSGTSWTWSAASLVAPDAEGYGFLNGVACITASSCVAVGLDGNDHSIVSAGSEASGEWSWSQSAVVGSASLNNTYLNSVSCFLATSCMAVGADTGNNAIFSSGVESNGRWTWSPTEDVPPDTLQSGYLGTGDLTGVSCPSATTCVAVGTDSSLQAFYSVATQVNGVWSWSTGSRIAPDTSAKSYINDVSCPSAAMCVAVGRDTSVQAIYSVGVQTDGAWSWSASTTIAADSAGHGRLDGVNCPTVTKCLAVGYDSMHREISATGTDVSGVWTWSAPTVIPPDSSGGGYLALVSCPSATTCVTVGFDAKHEPIVAVATLRGQSWTWQRTQEITPDRTKHGYFNGVSCASTVTCVAVGYDSDGHAIYSRGTRIGNAWKWTDSIGVASVRQGHGFFNDVSCFNPLSCVVVGYDGSPQAIADSNLNAR